jgi:hypothetical protein
MNMYGTTLRVWDPSIQAWRITWRNPAGDHHENQIGGRSGTDVAQIVTRPIARNQLMSIRGPASLAGLPQNVSATTMMSFHSNRGCARITELQISYQY